MKSSALIGVPLFHFAFGFSLYTTVCGFALVTCGSAVNKSELYLIFPLGWKMNADGTIRFSCSTVSTTEPASDSVFQFDGYLPRATTMSPPALRGPLLHVSGSAAQVLYPADDCVAVPWSVLVPQAATPSTPTTARATRPPSLFAAVCMVPPWSTATAKGVAGRRRAAWVARSGLRRRHTSMEFAARADSRQPCYGAGAVP